MSDDVVQRAKKALEDVAYGPWECDFTEDTLQKFKTAAIWLGDGDLGALIEPHYQCDANAYFIAEARSLVPELVAEIERLRGERS